MKTVLFICSGNTCRSPLAEAIARNWLDQRGDSENESVFVASAGVSADDGAPPTAETVEALRRIGVEYDGRSKSLTAEMIRKADVVLCMTEAHLNAVRDLVAGEDYDTIIARVDPQGDVSDPIGQGQNAYDALVERFHSLIPRRLEETLFNEDRAGIRSSR